MSETEDKKDNEIDEAWNHWKNWFNENFVESGKKPCHILGFCVYGPLVESYQISVEPTKKSCEVFGHDCPVFYVAEPFISEDEYYEGE